MQYIQHIYAAVRNFQASSNQPIWSALFDSAIVWAISRYSLLRIKSFRRKERDKRYCTHTLLSHLMVPYYVIGLYSLLRLLSRMPEVRIHDDGTLTREDYDLLLQIPRIRIYTFEEGNKKAPIVFGDKSILPAERIVSVYSRKLIDLLLFPQEASGSLLLDPDILFFRYPEFLDAFFSGKTDTEMVYMQDVQNAYIAPVSVLCKVFKTRFVPKLNSGLIGLRSSSLTTPEVQAYYSKLRAAFSRKSLFEPWIEQTGYAAIASSLRARPLPENYRVGQQVTGETVCTHYVHGMRGTYPGGLLRMLMSERVRV